MFFAPLVSTVLPSSGLTLGILWSLLSMKSATLFDWSLGESSCKTLYFSGLEIILILLTIVIAVLIFLVKEPGVYWGAKALLQSWLATTMVLAFCTNSLLIFYVFFEMSLMPILLIILGWGYQPERLPAGMSMMIYTLVGSLPLLVFILCIEQSSQEDMITRFHFSSGSGSSSIIGLGLILAFLVKLPIFGAHLWLPRAHVEAPVDGSMVLAAVMLKLGGYGVLVLSPIIGPGGAWSLCVCCISLVGGASVSWLALRQSDSKILIAYSSVAHMGMALAASLVFTQTSVNGSLMAYLAHGFASAGLFFLAGLLSNVTQSRSLILSRGFINTFPVLSMFSMIVIMANMGTPPTLNFYSEILMLIALTGYSVWLWIPLSAALTLATGFSLVLFYTSQHSSSPAVSVHSNSIHTTDTCAMASLCTFVLISVLLSSVAVV